MQLANTPPLQSTTPGLHPVSIHQTSPHVRGSKQNADNATTLRIRFDKLGEVYATATSPLSEVTIIFVYLYLLQYDYLIDSPKVKASAKNVHLRYKHKLVDIYSIHWYDYELHQ